MNKKIYSIVGIILVLAVIIGIVVYTKNNKTGVDTNTPGAATSTAKVTITSVERSSVATAAEAGTQVVSWQTDGYPANVGVNINLLRKTSDSPESYELVRQIASNTPNDGSESWTPGADEKGNDLYIEVTCSDADTLAQGCSLTAKPIKVN